MCPWLPLQRARVASGADTVRTEIDVINKRYMEMLADLNRRLHQLKSVYDTNGALFPVSMWFAVAVAVAIKQVCP